ncbi:hypothetical protein COT78_03160 [Candidatus Berkelbacteria bacterium CG10_big_fil_rev_8_21_14_0_10_43_13]|uniref:AtpZ/AtpI family protein n=1 Tax=Candidatus Berkelbacteria bacterium CG10_big_fil_rev_8_21_14_0_10_43_13 TaxID=1974514 RepID=A0A2H0W830_9BACT|nr:MAG: hypothetical protein COT78_03160 [Candidatus Berkelbacteria bacterium CG10_big_fil_rev_8_21_14_0_10_43_13]
MVNVFDAVYHKIVFPSTLPRLDGRDGRVINWTLADINGVFVKKSLIFAFRLIGTIGFATVIPLVAFALFGRWLDGHFNTGHNFFYTGIVAALPVVYLTVRQVAKDAVGDFEQFNKNEKQKG